MIAAWHQALCRYQETTSVASWLLAWSLVGQWQGLARQGLRPVEWSRTLDQRGPLGCHSFCGKGIVFEFNGLRCGVNAASEGGSVQWSAKGTEQRVEIVEDKVGVVDH